MGGRGRISELASIIESRTAAIEGYLESQNIPSPSFSVEVPPILPLPEHLQSSPDEIWNASTELQALVVGPLGYLSRVTNPANNIFMGLHAIYKYRIAFNLKLDEEVSYEEIAWRCGMHESDARRLIRMAISCHIFLEPRKGVVAHSAASKLLCKFPRLHQWIGIVCMEMLPSAARAIDAMEKWPGSEEPQHTGFALAAGTGETFFESLGRDLERTQRFSDGMQFLQSGPPFDLVHLFTDLGWDDESCPSLVVDVGGSHGSIALELLHRFPSIRKCIVEDLPEVIDIAKVPDAAQDRLEFKAHNFFTEQPIKNADAYLLRSILHDWSDKYAIQILRNMTPALKPGARIIINEVCLPDPGTIPFYQESILRGYDLAMKHTCNSKERDADDWAALLTVADPRFKLNGIRASPGSVLSVIEVLWESE